VQSLRQAREVLDQDADIIVAQGTEAGGQARCEPPSRLFRP
jgi:NAD(P)H-dependent flavin oxidoreductase YrpB (nitropropane dioxygenase family)